MIIESSNFPTEDDENDHDISDNLPIRLINLIEKNPDLSPVKIEDFRRLESFFQRQVHYFMVRATTEESIGKSAESKKWKKFSERAMPLFNILVDNIRIITEEMFNNALVKISHDALPLIQSGKAKVFLHGKDMDEAQLHSTFHIARKLGININDMVTESDLDENAFRFIENGGTFIVIDDGIYSGQNVMEHLTAIKLAVPNFKPENLKLFLVGATNSGIELLERIGISNINWMYKIQQLQDIDDLEEDDLQILRFMERIYKDDEENTQIVTNWRDVLTLFWQKVPDNFCHPLRKQRNYHGKAKKGMNFRYLEDNYYPGYLVDDTPNGIYPEYRKGKRFIFS